ncbi:hypothetical protein [Gemmatimonas sp.]
MHEETPQDELNRAASARVTLEVRILDAEVTSRQPTPSPTPVPVPDGPGPLVIILITDVDLCRYLYTHVTSVRSWRVVAAENAAHAQQLLTLAHESTAAPVLVLDAPDAPLLAQLSEADRVHLRVVLLADAFPPGFEADPARHVLLPWPLDVPVVMQYVAAFVS